MAAATLLSPVALLLSPSKDKNDHRINRERGWVVVSGWRMDWRQSNLQTNYLYGLLIALTKIIS